MDYNGTLLVHDETDNDWVRILSVRVFTRPSAIATFSFVIQVGFVWAMLDIHNFYMVISNRQDTSGACKIL